VGVSINLFIRKQGTKSRPGKIHYARLDEFCDKQEKFAFLQSKKHYGNIEWQEIKPNANHTWLTEGLKPEFDAFFPLGTKQGKAGKEDDVLFRLYSNGVDTARDSWVYNFQQSLLTKNVRSLIQTYNIEIYRWQDRENLDARLDDFVLADGTKIKWSSRLKECLLRGKKARFSSDSIRLSLYRPFCQKYLYFDPILNHRQAKFSRIFPTPKTGIENRVIVVKGIGIERPFYALMSNIIPSNLVCKGMLSKKIA
jgi:predicted helicase